MRLLLVYKERERERERRHREREVCGNDSKPIRWQSPKKIDGVDLKMMFDLELIILWS